MPEGTRIIALEALDERFGMELLGLVAGAERVQAQAADALRIVHSTGGYPLALRIAAARLAGRPQWRLSRLADRLDDQRRRLGELQMGDEEVRAGFALSYDGLDPDARRLFRLLGLVNLVDFPTWLPAVLLDAEPDDAEELAGRLSEAHLLQVGEADASGSARYRFHDLLRAFASERLEAESDEPEQSGALSRMLDAYVLLTIRADAGFSAANSAIWGPWDAQLPPLPAEYVHETDDHLEWFTKERANLLRVIERAHGAQRWETALRLAVAMWQFLEITARFADWRAAFDLALDAARQAGDEVAEGSSLRLLGRLELTRGNIDAAAGLFEQALALLASAGDVHGTSMARKDMSVVARLRNRHGASIDMLLSALDGFIGLAEHYWVAIVRRELGIEDRYEGQWAEAYEQFRQAIAVFESIGEDLQTAQTRFELAVLERLRGNWAAARLSLDLAAPVFDQLDARGQQAWALRESALVAAGTGDLDMAVSQLTRCLDLWQELDDARQHAGTLHELALVRQRRGEVDEALAASREAAEEFREAGDELATARALVTQAALSTETGAPEEALATVEQALPVFRACADLLWEVKAQRARAAAYRMIGNADAAREADVLADGLGQYVRAADEIRI
jgi:tetratricopeptide (TPR) repeat protein